MLSYLPKIIQLTNGRASLMGAFLTLSFFIYKMWGTNPDLPSAKRQGVSSQAVGRK